MIGDHELTPRGLWRATATSFLIRPYRADPVMWISGGYVWGQWSAIVAQPDFNPKPDPETDQPEALVKIEIAIVDEVPTIRTWWGRGANPQTGQRVVREEVLDPRSWHEKMRHLLRLLSINVKLR